MRQSKTLINCRSSKPANVLVAMKAVVISCKDTIEYMEERVKENGYIVSEQKALEISRGKLSEALTNLMTISKNHAVGKQESEGLGGIENGLNDLTIVIQAILKIGADYYAGANKKSANVDALGVVGLKV